MTDAPAPVLVYNRIDANRRNTRLLFACFAAVGLPVLWGASQFLAPALSVPAGVFDPEHPFRSGVPAQVAAFGIVALATVLVCALVYLGSIFSSFLLWQAGARAVARDAEPELRRTVENLCIGAGLPPPKLYVAENPAPNAFAVGIDPQRASLVVSKGLLKLLDRRELSGVLAHELSHIANRDTELFTALAAFVAVVRLPQFALTAAVRLGGFFGIFSRAASPIILWAIVVYVVVVTAATGIELLGAASAGSPLPLTSAQAVAMLMPAYALVAAPIMAMLLRKTISYQREFLADADAALLTRDPEGLALALAKTAAAAGAPVHTNVALAHMFFVDPVPAGKASWLRGRFPSHPPVDDRIAVLTKMGDGVVEGLTAAADAGVSYRGEMLLRQYSPAIQPATPADVSNDDATHYIPGTRVSLAGRTALYKSAEHLSEILADLDPGAVVTIIAREGSFCHVRATDGQAGYIDSHARTMRCEADEGHDLLTGFGIHYRTIAGPAFTPRSVPGTKFRLTDHMTPLYTKPDGWSDVLQQLSAGQVVTYGGLDGNFARVQAEFGEGYIPHTAGAQALTAQPLQG